MFDATPEPPVLELVRELRAFFQVKVVLAIRNQSKLITSTYIENSKWNGPMSSGQYCDQVRRLLHDEGPLGWAYFDFSMWISRFTAEIDNQSVLAVGVESLYDRQGWRTLAEFCGTPEPRQGYFLNSQRTSLADELLTGCPEIAEQIVEKYAPANRLLPFGLEWLERNGYL